MRPRFAISCCRTNCLERYALTLVDAHLECVPSLGTLTARSLTGGDLQVLGGKTDGTLDAELLVLGTVDELLADLLEALDVARGEGDADLEAQSVYGFVHIQQTQTCLVDLGTLAEVLLGLVVRHLVGLECCLL
jgi:hypothetical protein